MAGFSDTVKIVIDVVTDKAASGLQKVKSDVDNAEGSFGKLKAGASGALDQFTSQGPLVMAGAATAIGAGIGKLIGDFTDLAIEAKNFSTASGLSVEDASRWIETAGDLGVETDAVQGAMSRLNREADQGKLAKFGITADNANDRLIETLEYLASIPDEAARSQASFELLGKGGAAMAPLIANVETLRDRLAEVKGGKLISDADAEEARRFKDTMDSLADSAQSIALQFGKAIAPVVEKLANVIVQINEATGGEDAGGGLIGWLGKAVGFTPGIDGLTGILGALGVTTDEVESSTTQAATAINNASAALEEETANAAATQQALLDLQSATLAQFNSQLAANSATETASEKVADYTTKLGISAGAAGGSTEANKATSAAMDEAARAALSSAAANVQLATDQATANGATLTAQQQNAILVQSLQGVANTLAPGNPLRVQLEGYISKLNTIPTEKTTDIKLNTRDADALLADWESRPRSITYNVKTITSRVDPGVVEPRASGGPVEAGQPYVVGEKRPELFVPNQDGMILPKVPTVSGAALSGSPIVVNVNGALGSPRELGKTIGDEIMWKTRMTA